MGRGHRKDDVRKKNLTKLQNLFSSPSGTGGGGESVMSVNVGGVTLPAMEPGRMREVVRSALLTFDLIHFNLVGLLQRLD